MYLDGSTSGQLSTLQDQGWTDRVTSVVFLEFAQYNPATYWYVKEIVKLKCFRVSRIDFYIFYS